MINIVAAIIYCAISFVTWLSVSFSLMSKVASERCLFLNISRAILVYVVGGVFSVIMTFVSYVLVCSLQKVI